MDSLKRSIKDLEPPSCSTCNIEMKWYRSMRAAADSENITHFFHCPNCNRIAEVKTKMRGNGNERPPPSKLMRPRHVDQFVCM